MPQPFTIAAPDERLAAIRRKVAAFDWETVPDAGGWHSGVGLADLRHLVDYWLQVYDWRAQEAQLNQFPHFITNVLGEQIHFIHARGNGSRPPLLLLHGWPGSFLEFLQLIGPLTADGHDVIVPSLPGFAFSGRPRAPIGPRRVAELFHHLMTDLFRGERYIVQGGDWGAHTGAWLAHGYPGACLGLHINMIEIMARDAVPTTEAELAWARRRAELAERETGYSHQQRTRPQTLGVGLSDSPVGIAAWILEKFGVWADLPRGAGGSPDLWQVFPEDLLLTNIMLYVAPAAFVTSTWIYQGEQEEGATHFAPGTRIEVPTGVAAFPDPVFPPPPRSHVAKTYNVVHWSDMPAGGHFAALEQPAALLHDLRAFIATLG
ncbi:MAG: alpha/beta fold hydrolase [Thermomicrobiales bacterium]